MGFIAVNLSSYDEYTLTSLEFEIVRSLNFASVCLNQNIYYSQVWFGDVSREWISNLSSRLSRMAFLIEFKSIKVHYIEPAIDYASHYAIAYRPRSGWRDNLRDEYAQYDFIVRSEGQEFDIGLGDKWQKSPNYRNYREYNSKFMILVHELSHLFMHTLDITYHYGHCRLLASRDPLQAKFNANNWGYFVEEFIIPR